MFSASQFRLLAIAFIASAARSSIFSRDSLFFLENFCLSNPDIVNLALAILRRRRPLSGRLLV